METIVPIGKTCRLLETMQNYTYNSKKSTHRGTNALYEGLAQDHPTNFSKPYNHYKNRFIQCCYCLQNSASSIAGILLKFMLLFCVTNLN